MKTIPLSKGLIAIVDDRDYDHLIRWSWYALWNGRTFYAAGSETFPDGTVNHFLMHRVILKAQTGEFVDHKDTNTLDNRRKNLRRCTKSQNAANSKIRKDNSTGYKGVSTTTEGNWRATIQIDGKSQNVGHFKTPIEAALAYDRAALAYYGEFARTNYALGLVASKLN